MRKALVFASLLVGACAVQQPAPPASAVAMKQVCTTIENPTGTNMRTREVCEMVPVGASVPAPQF